MANNTNSHSAGTRPGFALAIIAVACIMLPVSLGGASVALPGIAESLNASLTSLQWVINGYDLTFAAFMLATGSLGDLLGRRRMFLTGMAVFSGALLLCGLANDILILDLARGLAGIGAAAALTCGVASLATLYTDPRGQARAFGVFGTAVGCGLAFGPFICGVLNTHLGWRSVFLAPAAVGLLVLACGRMIPESRNPDGKRIDWAGTATFTAALLALILGLLEGPQQGWTSAFVLGCFVAAALLLVAFTVVERRQSQPMFDLSLFAQRRYASLCLAVVALVFGFTPLLVYLPSYYIAVDGVTSQQAGLTLMMLTLPTLVMPTVTGYLARWIPVRVLVLASVALTGVGVAWLTVIHPGASNLLVLGPYVTVGIGIGISFGVLDGAAVSSVDPGRVGMAAGMFNTMRLGGEAIGIAVVGTALAGITGANLADRLGGFDTPYARDPQGVANLVNQGDLATAATTVTPATARGAFEATVSEAYTGALHTALWWLAGLCALAVVILLVLDRPSSGAASTEEDELDVVPATAQ